MILGDRYEIARQEKRNFDKEELIVKEVKENFLWFLNKLEMKKSTVVEVIYGIKFVDLSLLIFMNLYNEIHVTIMTTEQQST